MMLFILKVVAYPSQFHTLTVDVYISVDFIALIQ